MQHLSLAVRVGDSINAVVWALRVSASVGGPDPADHLAELRLHLLRSRREPWRPSRRGEVDRAVAAVMAHIDGRDAVVPFSDLRATRRLLSDLKEFERALRHATPRRATSDLVAA